MIAISSRVALYLFIGLTIFVFIFAMYREGEQASDFQGNGLTQFRRYVSDEVPRGQISDRNGNLLAESVLTKSVWVQPSELLESWERLAELEQALNLEQRTLENLLIPRASRQFVWLKRHATASTVAKVNELNIPGVYFKNEYARNYPFGEAIAPLVGITNLDSIGQEGLELAYDGWLSGTRGERIVKRDLKGNIIENLEQVQTPIPGRGMQLTIDSNIQIMAFNEITETAAHYSPTLVSLILLDATTGGVLSMVNLPTFDPNLLETAQTQATSNFALRLEFEPAALMIPFSIASALESGIVEPLTLIDVAPGVLQIGDLVVRDPANFELLTVAEVVSNNSKVGVGKIVLELEGKILWETFTRFGFGKPTEISFPGESSGVLRNPKTWNRQDQVALSYGEGVSVHRPESRFFQFRQLSQLAAFCRLLVCWIH